MESAGSRDNVPHNMRLVSAEGDLRTHVRRMNITIARGQTVSRKALVRLKFLKDQVEALRKGQDGPSKEV